LGLSIPTKNAARWARVVAGKSVNDNAYAVLIAAYDAWILLESARLEFVTRRWRIKAVPATHRNTLAPLLSPQNRADSDPPRSPS
jgi:hypothetical protein